MRIHFITFGEGHRLRRSAALRLGIEASKSQWFDSVTPGGMKTLNSFNHSFVSSHIDFINRNPRGFGYWIWKPFLIWQALLKLPQDDLLVYADAGFELNTQGRPRFKHYTQLAMDHQLFGFDIDAKIRQWTKADLISCFGSLAQTEITDSYQRAAGLIITRNSSMTRSFFREWYLLCVVENYRLVDDSPSKVSELDGFIEHRHDQSIFSLLSRDRGLGTYIQEEIYFPELWDKGCHPPAIPFASFRNSSAIPRFAEGGKVRKWQPAVYEGISDYSGSEESFFGIGFQTKWI